MATDNKSAATALPPGWVDIPPVIEHSPLVISILALNPGPFTLQGTNTYFVGSGASRVLIDTGDGTKPEYFTHLSNVMKKHGIASISDIIFTHWHYDHTGGLKQILSQCLGLKSSETAASATAASAGSPSPSPSPPMPRLWKYADSSIDSAHGSEWAPYHFEAITPGMCFPVSGGGGGGESNGGTAYQLRALHTPGHTDDSVSFILEATNQTKLKSEAGTLATAVSATAAAPATLKALFSGDCILGFGTTSIGALAPYMASLHAIESEKSDVIYPAHGPVIKDPASVVRGYITHRNAREQQIIKALQLQTGGSNAVPSAGTSSSAHLMLSSLSILELVNAVYGNGVLAPSVMPAAAQNVFLHLEKLQSEGKVVRRTPDATAAGANASAVSTLASSAAATATATATGAAVEVADSSAAKAAAAMAKFAASRWSIANTKRPNSNK